MSVLLVASVGGHLSELSALVDRLGAAPEERVWATWRNPQSESLLAGEVVEWVPPVHPRDARAVLSVSGRMRRLLLDRLGEAGLTDGLVGAGHRVVHGGRDFTAPVRLGDAEIEALARLIPLAPLHQPHNVAAIRALKARRLKGERIMNQWKQGTVVWLASLCVLSAPTEAAPPAGGHTLASCVRWSVKAYAQT